jgi:hypothetical protein
MTACLAPDFNGGGLSGKRGGDATSTASRTFDSLSASERPGVRSDAIRVRLGDRLAREQAWHARLCATPSTLRASGA